MKRKYKTLEQRITERILAGAIIGAAALAAWGVVELVEWALNLH